MCLLGYGCVSYVVHILSQVLAKLRDANCMCWVCFLQHVVCVCVGWVCVLGVLVIVCTRSCACVVGCACVIGSVCVCACVR